MSGGPPRRPRAPRFPDPGEPTARLPGERSEDWQRALDAQLLPGRVNDAVHGSDPEWRRELARHLCERLRSGEPLAQPYREWLIFVLEELLATDTIPTRHRGRPSDTARSNSQMIRAALRLAELARTSPKMTAIERVEIVGHELGLTVSSVETLRKDPVFKELLRVQAEIRREREAQPDDSPE